MELFLYFFQVFKPEFKNKLFLGMIDWNYLIYPVSKKHVLNGLS